METEQERKGKTGNRLGKSNDKRNSEDWKRNQKNQGSLNTKPEKKISSSESRKLKTNFCDVIAENLRNIV